MRITIIQAEIEEAIKNHILGQIHIKDGMDISIELRATRGAEGMQADIDITPTGSAQPETLEVTRKVAETKASPAPTTTTEAASTDATEVVDAPQPEAEETTGTVAASGKSLFGGKPSNG